VYPNEELRSLAAGKALLRQRISTRRLECAAEASRLARPIAWIDRALAGWRRLSPLVKMASVPVGLWMGRSRARPLRTAGAVLRWGPVLLGVFRSLTHQRGLSGRD
jgi:hypothetical protein